MKNLILNLIICAALGLSIMGAKTARAEKHPTNACGCYGEGESCICDKKAKCGCPGECEPKGCEVERQKQLAKEMEVETKRAKEQEAARSKALSPAKSDDDDDAPASGKDGAGAAKGPKAPAVKPMTTVQKKQLLKLIEAYLAEHPEAANKMLFEVRSEL